MTVAHWRHCWGAVALRMRRQRHRGRSSIEASAAILSRDIQIDRPGAEVYTRPEMSEAAIRRRTPTLLVVLTFGDDRQYGGNAGFDDKPNERYRYDNFVQNDTEIARGDCRQDGADLERDQRTAGDSRPEQHSDSHSSDYSFSFSLALFSAMKARMFSASTSSFSHCS
jgi:hypothetical protein